jgi:hypothetical protein
LFHQTDGGLPGMIGTGSGHDEAVAFGGLGEVGEVQFVGMEGLGFGGEGD